MTKVLCKKVYYKIEFFLKSPLTIGSGEDIITDRDIIKNRNGVPYIPATALAGIYRVLVGDKQDEYFGYVRIAEDLEMEISNTSDLKSQGKEQMSSEIIVYDGNLEGDFYISQRDGIELDEWKTVKKGSKFNFEVLETNARFVTFLEITERESVIEKGQANELREAVEKILKFLQSGTVHLGARTTRGYGQIKAEHIWKAEFDFNEEEEIKKWLDFDLYTDKSKWCEVTKNFIEFYADKFLQISLNLKQKSGIFIRKYTTDKKIENKEIGAYRQQGEMYDLKKQGSDTRSLLAEIQVGSEQLTLHDKNRSPVIPGSSWAGAFRHHFERLIDEAEGYENEEKKLQILQIKQWFGYVNKKEKKKKESLIIFHETILDGAREKTVTRNAIDRFTGGTIDGALFKEKFYINGYGTLEILIKKENIIKEKIFFQLLAATIMDLHNGMLSVGGVTASGRGLFEVQSVKIGQSSGIKIKGNESYIEIYQKLQKEWEN